MGILTYKGRQFYLDGEPFVVLSGAMHYFRIPKEYWYDRLLKLKECGFNTVETYTCWNLHEPREGEFNFSGNLDIGAYIDTAESLGLNVILRPGPFICAEWEFGGLPAWLLAYGNISIRCYDEMFISKVRSYYKQLLRIVRPRLAVNGGNVFMLQIENEYGSFGDDKRYLQAIVDIYRENGIDCLFFTSDGATHTMQSGGALDGYLAVANFGSNLTERLGLMSARYPEQPLMCGEYWCGWFDHWFEDHHVRPSEDIIANFGQFMQMGASMNVYMFHGGTNFGFMNGANYSTKYEPTVTSYDYNSPLNEAGDRTPLYYELRELIAKRYGDVPPLTAKDSEKAAYGKVTLDRRAYLFDNLDVLSSPIQVTAPKYMEDVGQDYGYVLYRTHIKGPRDPWTMRIDSVHDRAQIFIDGKSRAVFERWIPDCQEKADVRFELGDNENVCLDILVENMGRVNYGPKLWDHKGIKGVRFNTSFNNQYHFGWSMYPLTMTNLSELEYEKHCGEIEGPVFLKGELEIKGMPKDTFLRLDGFTKGFVTVNGINIGRYFNPAGPQKTLYVPAPFLKEGINEIVVFESDKTTADTVEFLDSPDLG